MKNEVFLDTSYALALSVRNDNLHQRAIHLAELLEAAVTSRLCFFYRYARAWNDSSANRG